jgi:hypothetical protein
MRLKANLLQLSKPKRRQKAFKVKENTVGACTALGSGQRGQRVLLVTLITSFSLYPLPSSGQARKKTEKDFRRIYHA